MVVRSCWLVWRQHRRHDEIYGLHWLEPAAFWAYYTRTLELVGGGLLIVGLVTRPVAVLMVGLIFAGTFFEHWQFGYFWTARGFSVPLLLLVLSLAFVICGRGEYSLDRTLGRKI
jgi:putative oxidoreductase